MRITRIEKLVLALIIACIVLSVTIIVFASPSSGSGSGSGSGSDDEEEDEPEPEPPTYTYIEKAGNCISTVIKTYDDFDSAKQDCNTDNDCEAVYVLENVHSIGTNKSLVQTRSSCCKEKPPPYYCTAETHCKDNSTVETYCDTHQGGKTYVKS